jgi:hypothetical protein
MVMESFPTISRTCLNFPNLFIYLFTILFDFQYEKCSIFNNFSIVGRSIMKPPLCTPAHQGLSNGSKSTTKKKTLWFGMRDFNMANKQTTFLYR